MTCFTHAASHATPHDPILDPDRFLPMICDALREQRSRLLGSPFIERITKARTQRVSRELKPNPLVVGGTTTPASSSAQCPPQFTQHRDSPLLASAQCLLESAPDLFDLACGRRRRR